MKYKGNKALMKCCKSCQNKKRIKCIGQPQIYKYQGYKFCTECKRSDKDIEKSFKSLYTRINLNKRICYCTAGLTETINIKENMTTQSDAYPQIVIPQFDIEEIEKINKAIDVLAYNLGRIIRNFTNALKKRMHNYGKS